ncbi:MAG: hypothetical protein F6K23_23520 [Okeania sp. SIO2C9]|uniref:hypothetical protein n=1 Tax=Okeania sp. SIO2C9 TaxID=2607791 RepID=UPI0013C217BE|nr:hypothetical protein [Okeania sp. SIO2C9]NEQ75751.1 hypothetical protein [Okeania sp. SIO2C9]
MKQNIIIFGLIASAGLTFCQLPKAIAGNLRPSNESSIEKSQIISYEGSDEDGNKEDIDTQK